MKPKTEAGVEKYFQCPAIGIWKAVHEIVIFVKSHLNLTSPLAGYGKSAVKKPALEFPKLASTRLEVGGPGVGTSARRGAGSFPVCRMGRDSLRPGTLQFTRSCPHHGPAQLRQERHVYSKECPQTPGQVP